MARIRCITEMGMGVDVHGKDATKAARRADAGPVQRALHPSSGERRKAKECISRGALYH